jgi:hypothetical protein
MERVAVNRRQLLVYGAFGLGAAALAPGFGRARAQQPLPREKIERIAIHPAIGIARIGNSPDGWFLGPEVAGPLPVPEGGFKDAEGRIKRQAARFRLYGLDADGQVLGEVTAADAEIAWTVHLANSKAAWYEFDIAFDLPNAKGLPPAPGYDAPEPATSSHRNGDITDRSQLTIDPGPRTVSGAGANADGTDAAARFDGGTFFGQEVPLGELRTDEAGRLLVLGGMGRSGSALPGLRASDLANNDYWHDDASDGPVDATVRIDGREIPVTGAWVVTCPPNYAPGMQPVVTMYDILFEVATALEPERKPERPSFTRMIYPLFARMTQSQWVNAGFLREFGHGAPSDFLAPEHLARLASPDADAALLRQQVFARFRDPAYTSMEASALPPYYGDDWRFTPATPRQWMAVLPIQYGWLQQWANGDFEADWPAEGLQFPARIEDLPLAEQPTALDRAALDDCLGGPFRPGIDLPWIMRQPLLYAAPFRIRRRQGEEPDWGGRIMSEVVLAEDGPLSGSGPGAITRWLAVPWQTDVASCLSGYQGDVDAYLPAFWPARVPNHVLSPESYQTVMDSAASLEDRQHAFANRVDWLRGLSGFDDAFREWINAFTDQWPDAGVVTQQPGPDDDAPFPETFWVELGHALAGKRE